MSTPEQIQDRIEQTRSNLSADVDRLSEKVTPSKVVGRRVETIKGAASSVKERVMGTTESASSGLHSAGDSVSSAASSVSDAASNAPQAVRQRAQGNPMAPGLI